MTRKQALAWLKDHEDYHVTLSFYDNEAAITVKRLVEMFAALISIKDDEE